jgi:hypothetical protein
LGFALLLTAARMNPWYLLPIAGSGFQKVVWYGCLNMSAFGEILMLPYLIPYLDFDIAALEKAGRKAILLSGACFILVVMGYTMLFSLPGSLEHPLPFFQMSRMAQVSVDLQRLEMFFALGWAFFIFLRIAAALAWMAVILAQTTGGAFPYRRSLVVFGLAAALCLFFGRSLDPRAFQAMAHHGFLVPWILPFLALGFCKVRGRNKP